MKNTSISLSFATVALIILSLSTFNSYAADITIILQGKIRSNSRLQVYSYKNLEEKVTLQDITIDVRKEINLHLDYPEHKYYFFSVNGKICEALIDASHKNTITFDFDENDWIKLTNGRKTDPVLFSYFAQFRNYDNRNIKDSASYVAYQLQFMNQLGISPLSEKQNFNDVQNYARKMSFNTFCNTVMGKRLFTITQNFNKGINKNIKDWADLESLQLKQASYYDLLAIRNFHMFFSHEILPYRAGKLTLYEMITFAEDWLSNQSYEVEVKNYMLGDMIQFWAKLSLEIDQKLINKLEELYKVDSVGHHADFIRKLITRYNNQILGTTKFNVQAVDLTGQKLELSQIKEKIIFIDFWATWCTPCIKEEPFIEELRSEYKDKVAFVKISIDEDYGKWKAYLSKNNSSELSYILPQNEEREKTISTFNLQAIPKYIIINNEGTTINFIAARPSDPKLKEVLDELLKE